MATNWTQGSGVYTLTTQLQEKGANNWPPNQIPNTYPPYTTFTQGLGAWGRNNAGQLGQGDTIYRSSPVQVGALTSWYRMGTGSEASYGVKTDGTLWSWGVNSSGQLGLNNSVNRVSPVQVGALTSWTNAVGGQVHTLATKTDGTLWSWGSNSNGQLGQNISYATSKSSPVQVGALTTWRNIASGNTFTLATKTDGTLWSWGNNSLAGSLGQNNTINRSSPVQVGALTTWLNIASGAYHSLATKTDGTLWSWGYNVDGELGQNNTIYRSSPVQVGALTTWLNIASGAYHSLATRTDGTLWAWGQNTYGQVGQNNTIKYSSPVQVGALTTWSKISAGHLHTTAMKTDGTLWAWGWNIYGQLGHNNTVSSSSPVQVGTLNTWIDVTCSNRTNSVLALLSQV